MGIVYKLTFENGKVYVGITTETLSRRVQRHIHYARSGRSYVLSCAIRKYGEESFTAEVIGSADSWKELVALEVDAIKRHGCICPVGYNMTAGGEGSKGVVPTTEKRQKISESLRGRKLTDEHRKAIGLAQKGKTIPLDTRKRMSEAHKNRAPMSEEQRRIRSEAAKRQHAARRKPESAPDTNNQPPPSAGFFTPTGATLVTTNLVPAIRRVTGEHHEATRASTQGTVVLGGNLRSTGGARPQS